MHRRAARGAWPSGVASTGLALLAIAGCELQEVAIPLGREQVAVHGVLTFDSNATTQYIVVERTVTGSATIPDLDTVRGYPRPPLPISGARVVVTRDDGDSVLYTEGATPGVYELARERAWPFLVPGRTYALRVDAPDGRQVRGLTRMPSTPVVSGMPAMGASFDRDRDTLRLGWTRPEGCGQAYVQVRPRDIRRRLTMVLFTDSTSLVIPGTLPLPFLSDTLPPSVWIAGTYQTLTVATMDRNFFDHLRSANDPLTGSGYLGHLEGGIGVFGAIAPVNRTVAVRGRVDHPFEGRYALRMRLGTDSLVGEVELFVTRERPEPVLVAGLVSGRLVFSGGGPERSLQELELSGRVEAGRLRVRLLEGGTLERVLEGPFSATGETTGVVRAAGGVVLGSYALARLP